MSSNQKSWTVAGVAALAIVVYFTLATVWLPSWVLRLPAVAQASRLVADLVGTAVWAAFLGLGMWAMRIAQRRGWI